jgi:oligosaccharyltransferase complex subunit gamma
VGRYTHVPGIGDRSAHINSPISADQVYAWINRHLPEGPKPALVRPVNYMRLISAVTILLGAITLFTVLSPYVLPIIRNRNLWAACSLIAILLFTSGHMFNHIRKVPYVAGDGKGGISYFAGGFQNQFGMETQIVAAICKWKICFVLVPCLHASNTRGF